MHYRGNLPASQVAGSALLIANGIKVGHLSAPEYAGRDPAQRIPFEVQIFLHSNADAFIDKVVGQLKIENPDLNWD